MTICMMCGHDHAKPLTIGEHEHQWRISGQTVNCRLCGEVQSETGGTKPDDDYDDMHLQMKGEA